LNSPTVTVLLPAYNAEAWIREAVDSIIHQSLSDFELLVVEDGSTDRTGQILGQYTDARIRLIRHETNRGLIASLNEGLELARGSFVARMDADDLAHPKRLERQVAFMKSNPEVGICGTWFVITGEGAPKRVRPPTSNDDMAAMLFFRSPFGHPTVMMSRTFLQDAGLRYNAEARHAEDFDFWVRARSKTRFANLAQYLLQYRAHPAQVSLQHEGRQVDAAGRIRLQQLALLIPAASEDEKRLHLRTCDSFVFQTRSQLMEARSWLDRLQAANRMHRIFLPRAFGRALAYSWAHCCDRATLRSAETFQIFIGRQYSGMDFLGMRQNFMFARRAIGK
jgi:glycosyltransferase involved in cell wall biosynthesis